MISDSIAKYVDTVNGLTVRSYRGATIAQMESFIKEDNLNLPSFDYIILHVGTNDIHFRSVKQIMQAYKFLFRACSNIAPRVPIAVSSILPRLVDYESSKVLCMQVNGNLEDYCKNQSIKFIRSYKRFLREGRPIPELYAKADGGLHLNYEGTRQLRQCIIHTVSHL